MELLLQLGQLVSCKMSFLLFKTLHMAGMLENGVNPSILISLLVVKCIVDLVYLMVTALNTKAVLILQCTLIGLGWYIWRNPSALVDTGLTLGVEQLKVLAPVAVWVVMVTILLSVMPKFLWSVLRVLKTLFDACFAVLVLGILWNMQ